MQERAWRQIRGEAARLAEKDREGAARERRVREEEDVVAQGAHRVLPDPEVNTPSRDVEGRSPSGKRARGEGGEAAQERGKRRRVEERGAGGAEEAHRPASPSLEPTPTDWGWESPPPRRYAPPPVRWGPATVGGWTAGDVAELVRYVKWAGRTRGGHEKRGTRPFSDLVARAGRPRERGPEMEEGRWRRMLGEALPGVSLGAGEEAQGLDPGEAVAAGGVIRGRGVGRGRSRTAVLFIINTGAPGTQGLQSGRADERQRGLQEGKTRGVGKGRRWWRNGLEDTRSRGEAEGRG